MKRSNILMIMVLGLFLLFAGCSNAGADKESGLFGGGSSKSSSSASGGVIAEILSLPPEVREGDSIEQARIRFLNSQLHEISDLEVKISGIDRNLVSGLPETLSGSKTIKAARENQEGLQAGTSETQLGGFQFQNIKDSFSFDMRFDYCYTAKTVYREKVCVPAFDSIECEEKFDRSVSLNGPLKLSLNNDVDAIGNTILVDLKIENSDIGKVVDSCFERGTEGSAEYKLIGVYLSGTKGDCDSSEILSSDEELFECEFTRTDDNEYLSELTAEFEYLYEQSTSQKVNIREDRTD